MSPTVLRIGSYRFFFYSREETRPHIHIEEGRKTAKFWLKPVSLAENYGFPAHELNRLNKLVHDNEEFIIKEWRDFFHG